MEITEKQFAYWVDEYADKLLQHAIFMLSDRVDAEDIVQEVFITAYTSREKFQQKSQPLTWLKGILNHKIADFYRQKYKNTQISFDYFFDENGEWQPNQGFKEWEDASNTTLTDDNDFLRTLEKCLEKLPEKWRILVKMCYLEEKKSDEICQETAVSTTNYWKILQRSRLQLKECLELNWFQK
ncbi:MAG: sigma-70 family RNA polymerase sigma factor [Capnocytophaga sp.]|nr:sigma-70 family RNA polymerase sigma factor [Capnocytophaga sp.]